MSRLEWGPIVVHAAAIVGEYDTGVTLRQLFYRLVADGTLPNRDPVYRRLSEHTAQARRDGWFPDLLDRQRAIHRVPSFTGVRDALAGLAEGYRLDRTRDQDVSLYVGVEKVGMVEQLRAWFGGYGFPIVALSGYSSQSYVSEVVADVDRQARPAILLYGGDFDASGEDIPRDFIDRSGCWSQVVRVALSGEQVDRFGLPEAPGKVTDSRAKGFEARHGRLVQVELDALDPPDLRGLYEREIEQWHDRDTYRSVVAEETEQRERLRQLAGVE